MSEYEVVCATGARVSGRHPTWGLAAHTAEAIDAVEAADPHPTDCGPHHVEQCHACRPRGRDIVEVTVHTTDGREVIYEVRREAPE